MKITHDAGQTRRHGGAFRCRAPPNENCAPPSEDCAPKKLTGSGLLECKSKPKTPKLVFTARIFVIFVEFRKSFGTKTFLFFLDFT